MIGVPPWDDVADLKDEGFVLTTNDNVPNYLFIHLNHKHPILKNKKVRQAINMAIDKEGLVQGDLCRHGQGSSTACCRRAPSPTIGTSANFYQLRSGEGQGSCWPRPAIRTASSSTGISIQYGTGELVESWIQRDLKKVGIDVKIQKFEWIAYLRRWPSGMTEDIGMNHIQLGHDLPLLHAHHRGQLRFGFPPNGVNSGWYCNEEVDKTDGPRRSRRRTRARRGPIYQQINNADDGRRRFRAGKLDDLQPIFVAPNVKGFVNPPNDWYDFTTVWIE